jgi:hypothetical protein
MSWKSKTAECSTIFSYIDILLKLDTNCKLTTQLYDKRDDINFSIVNFPYVCSNIPSSPAYGVNMSQLIRYTRACSTYNQFLISVFRPNAVWCISYQSLSRFWHTNPDYGSYRLPNLEIGLMAGVTGRLQGCLLLLGILSYLWYIQRFVFASFSDLHFLQGLWDWWLFVIYAISCWKW